MNQIVGTVQNGQVVLDSQLDLPDGTRVELHALPPTSSDQPSGEELDRLLDELADTFEEITDPSTPPLSDYAVSREGIYGDHP